MNLIQLLSPHLKGDNDNLAWIRRVDKSTRRGYTYSEIFKNHILLASELRKAGVESGDVISVLAPNGPEWGIVAMAVWRLGAVLAPIHIGNSKQDIDEQVDIVSPVFILTYKAPLTFANEIPILIRDESSFDESAIAAELNESVNVNEHQEAVRIYTSGSTGDAKLVRLSHNNLASNVLDICEEETLTPKDRFLSLLPLSHMLEMTAGMLLPLRSGAAIVLPRVMASSEIIKAMNEDNVTAMIGVPKLFSNIYQSIKKQIDSAGTFTKLYVKLLKKLPVPLRTRLNGPIRKSFGKELKFWVSGGAHLDSQIIKHYHDLGLSLRQGYGLTEVSPVVSVQSAFDSAVNSVGKPLKSNEIHVHEPDGEGRGEIWVKGPTVMMGYTDPAATDEVFDGDWFKTGDLGYVDSQGRICLTGRKKRLIVTEAGKNVYPEDIEIQLERIDEVAEAAVLDIENRPAAILVLSDDKKATDEEEKVVKKSRKSSKRDAASKVSNSDSDDSIHADHSEKRRDTGESHYARVKDVIKAFNRQASPHNQIVRFALVDELPRTPLGKIAYKNLKEVFLDHEVSG